MTTITENIDTAREQESILGSLVEDQATMLSANVAIKGYLEGFEQTFADFTGKIHRARALGVSFATIEATLAAARKSGTVMPFKASAGTLSTYDVVGMIEALPGDLPPGFVFRTDEGPISLPEGTTSVVDLVGSVIRPKASLTETINKFLEGVEDKPAPIYGKSVAKDAIAAAASRESAVANLQEQVRIIDSTAKQMARDLREREEEARIDKRTEYEKVSSELVGIRIALDNIRNRVINAHKRTQESVDAGLLSEIEADSLRLLAVDIVERARSGHPGAPMGMAEMAVALWDGID